MLQVLSRDVAPAATTGTVKYAHLHNLGVASVAGADLLIRHVWRFTLAVAGRRGHLGVDMQLDNLECSMGHLQQWPWLQRTLSTESVFAG
jgi:hypothetical protein